MNWRKQLGKQIRDARRDAKVSQQELGRRVRLSRQMIGRYEAGTAAPLIPQLAALARELGKEFRVGRYRIAVQSGKERPAPGEQLCFNYGEERVFNNAVIRIAPESEKLTITATTRVS